MLKLLLQALLAELAPKAIAAASKAIDKIGSKKKTPVEPTA